VNAKAKRAAPLLLVVLPGGAIAAAAWVAWRRWKKGTLVRTLTDVLRAGLPDVGRAYADDLAAAAADTYPDAVDVTAWAFFLSGIISRESGFGIYLRPRGPNGLGDGGHGHGLGQVDDRDNPDEPEWSARRAAHIASGDWTDSAKHLLFCAQLLRHLWDGLEETEQDGTARALGYEERLSATAAAYNAGLPRVADAIASGMSPDTRTTHGDYGADVLSRAGQFTTAAAAAAEETAA